MKRPKLSALVGVAALSAGCVLFVSDPPGASGTCRFSGDQSTACGTCLAKRCQPQVNRCCNGACGAALDALDKCGSGGNCYDLFSATGKADTLALSACASDACRAECLATVPADGGNGDTGGPSVLINCTSATDSCACSAKSGAGAAPSACSPSAIGRAPVDTVCCATDGWPSAGGKCSCGAFKCGRNAFEGCACDVAPTSSGDPVDEGLGGCGRGSPTYEWKCCVNEGKSCYCAHNYTGSCPSGWTSTTKDCTPVDIACPSGQKKVAACAP